MHMQQCGNTFRLYVLETSAHICSLFPWETNSYENPLLTATSRGIITDIYHAVQQWTEVDMPKPLAMLASLFGKAAGPRDPWFRVLRVWSEVGDICEAESFGACRASATHAIYTRH